MSPGRLFAEDGLPEWRALAAALEVSGPGGCEDSGMPDAWWPDGQRVDALVEAAQDICRSCPLRRECLAYALAADEREGIWGGLTPAERGVVSRSGRAL